jgi:glutaminase
MAYLMASYNVLGKNIDKYLDLYFGLCSLNINAAHLAHFGGILANKGENASQKPIVMELFVTMIKAIMMTCGMYDGSGEFAVTVGLPAKSGIGGGIVAAGSGFGIGVYGPALDGKGNSAGGMEILQILSSALNLHMFK